MAKTPHGKERSRMNAFKHGLRATDELFLAMTGASSGNCASSITGSARSTSPAEICRLISLRSKNNAVRLVKKISAHVPFPHFVGETQRGKFRMAPWKNEFPPTSVGGIGGLRFRLGHLPCSAFRARQAGRYNRIRIHPSSLRPHPFFAASSSSSSNFNLLAFRLLGFFLPP